MAVTPQMYVPGSALVPPQPDPASQLTAAGRDMALAYPELMQTPSLTAPYNTLAGDTHTGFMTGMQNVTGGAISPDNDPSGWTPDEAAAQTDRALARIAQVNPELAQSIAAQRNPEAVQEEDRGFWGDLMAGVGEVLHVTHIDQVLDLLGRPVHAINEALLDTDEGFWKNISDGLMGRSDANFADVLVERFGMDRNAFTAAIGLVGDIALDPLTYVTFGAGGIAKQTIGKAAGVASIQAALEKGTVKGSSLILDRVGASLGSKVAESELTNLAARAVFETGSVGKELAEKASSGIVARIRKAVVGSGVHPDAQSGLLLGLEGEASTALTELVGIGNNAFKATTTAGWARLTADTAKKLGIPKEEANRILQATVKSGTGFVSKGAYQEGKIAAATLGGVRLRVNAFGLRVAGARLPLASARMDFSMGRRFFAGLSGTVRLQRMVGTGEGGATVQALDAFWRGGFSQLKKEFPTVADKLGSGALNGGSLFYSMSEGMGKITKQFSSQAHIVRGGGLGAKAAGEARAQAQNVQRSVADAILSVVDDKGRVLTPDEVAGTIFGAAGKTDAERTAFYNKFDEAQVALTNGDEATHARLIAELETQPGGKQAVSHLESIMQQHDNELLRAGETPHSMGDDPNLRDDIHPDDVADVQGRSPSAQGKALVLTSGQPVPSNKPLAEATAADVDVDRVHVAEGTHGKEVPATGADGEVVHFPGEMYNRDTSPVVPGTAREATEEVDLYTEAVDEANRMLDAFEAGEGLPAKYEGAEIGDEMKKLLESEANRDAQVAGLVKRIFQGKGYSGIRTKVAEGDVRVVLFSDGKTLPAARVSKTASRMNTQASPIRALSEQAEEAARRVGGGQLVAQLHRKTQKLTLDKADHVVRALLGERGVNLDAAVPMFERDLKTALTKHVESAAKKAKDRYMGRAIERLEGVGLTRGAFQPNSVGIQRVKFVTNEAGFKALQAQADEVKKASERVNKWVTTFHLPGQHADAQAVADDLAEQQARLQRSLDEALLDIDSNTQAINTYLDQELNDLHDLAVTLGVDPETVGTNADFSPEAVTERIAAEQKLFDAARDTAEDLGGGVMRVRRGDAQTFYYVDDAGKVLGFREVNGAGKVLTQSLPGMRGKPVGFGAIGRGLGTRSTIGGGMTVGQVLHRAHWRDAGVFTGTAKEQLDKAFDLIKRQEFSGAGAKLNKRQVDELAERLKAQLRNQAAAKAKALKGKIEVSPGGPVVSGERELEQLQLPMVEDINEVNKIAARSSTERAPLMEALSSAERTAGKAGWQELGIPGFEKMSMPVFMATEFERAVSGPRRLNDAHLQFRRLNAWWKDQVTWLWPGFHLRNAEGGIFNNWLGGVDFSDYAYSARVARARDELFNGKAGRWASTKVRTKDADLIKSLRQSGQTHLYGVPIEDMTYGDMAAMMGGLNLTASNGRTFAEARLAFEQEATGRKSRLVERVPGGKTYVKGARGAGTLTENVMRGAAFSRGLKQSGSIMEARAFTMMRHGDYEDLTDWEYGFVRDLVPFYKWMRTNTPFQIHQLLESPGKLLATQKAGEAVYTAMGRDPNDQYKMPQWMRDSFTIPYGGDQDTFNTIMLDLPMSDLHMGAREYVSSFLPMVRPFLESYVTEQNTFTGAPLEGKPVELPSVLGPIAPLLRAVGLASSTADGGTVITDKTQNILSVIPVFSRMKNFIYEDPDRAKLRGNTVASAVFGLGMRAVDADALADNELAFYYDSVLPMVDWLRETGYQLPTTDDLTATIGSTDTILKSVGIDPEVGRYTEPAGGY